MMDAAMPADAIPAQVQADIEAAHRVLMDAAERPPDTLTDHLYQHWFQADGIHQGGPEAGAYAAATCLPERFEAGWTIAAIRPDGISLRHADGRQTIAALGDIAPVDATAPLVRGLAVRRLARTGSAVPGFWHLWSDGWRSDGPERMQRLYLPLQPDCLTMAAAVLVRLAPPADVWAAKFLRGGHPGPRRDPGLIYLPAGPLPDWLPAVMAGLAPMLGGPPVRLAAPWHGGWLADDPGGGRSFGQALCEVLAGLAGQAPERQVFAEAAWAGLRPLLGHLEPAR